jgi:hypothetical protein
MERDDGLAGARAALDDEHARLRAADDRVLLRLDRRDDVAELTSPAALERAEQRREPAQVVGRARAVGRRDDGHGAVRDRLVAGDAEVALTEQLVLQPSRTFPSTAK